MYESRSFSHRASWCGSRVAVHAFPSGFQSQLDPSLLPVSISESPALCMLSDLSDVARRLLGLRCFGGGFVRMENIIGMR